MYSCTRQLSRVMSDEVGKPHLIKDEVRKPHPLRQGFHCVNVLQLVRTRTVDVCELWLAYTKSTYMCVTTDHLLQYPSGDLGTVAMAWGTGECCSRWCMATQIYIGLILEGTS